ncbi:DUF1684 domain-containing protein [Microbacterium flavum]|uniref:DUF1684 domain-containing protein n=1 Tax=Microbacterium flavum TaxID=415216 RepID=A0ABS5XPS4_9MICO|nr:DUF1684 domain-containing protein [Microbacterium flavum]MBT8796525.1 DUF1684 domain-containing protein [Microbacterium flavum]
MTGPVAERARIAAEVVDWRRRTFDLYGVVRERSDPRLAHERWRSGRDEMMATHPASPLLEADRAAFAGLPVAPYDPDWRFEVPLLPALPETFAFPSGTDGVVPFERIARVELPGVGSLDVWRLTSYGGGIFIPLRDALAGRPGGTYGGGRYVIDTVKGADLGSSARQGTIVVDLNFAYNPSCAYDVAWACPLAPAGNVVSVPVPVGELYAAFSGS